MPEQAITGPIEAGTTSRRSSGPRRWAIATLIMLSARKGLEEHAIMYTHQVLLLGYQMSWRCPDVPMLPGVLEEQFGLDDFKLLESAGYQILEA